MNHAITGSEPAVIEHHFSSTARYWRDVYSGETVQSAIYRERRDLTLAWIDQLALPPLSTVLDVGCGAGLFSVAAAARGFRVTALDTVEQMLSQTAELAKSSGVQDRVEIRLGDAHALESANESFDLVLAIGITPWLHSVETALAEIHRVLKPGGHLIVTADNRHRLSYWLDPRFFPLIAGPRIAFGNALRRAGLRRAAHANTYSPAAFDRVLSRAGFDKQTSQTVGFGPFTLFEQPVFSASVGLALHNRLREWSNKSSVLRRVGSHYLVLARKPQPPSTTVSERN